MKLKKEEYFSDDFIIEDGYYIGIKDLILCPLCSKILKEPYICNECQKVYCKKCLEKDYRLKICPEKKIQTKFSPDVNSNRLLSNLKYRCRNCLEIVVQSDIKTHLESNCRKAERVKKEKTLSEIIQTKKELIKLSLNEVKNKIVDNTISGK